MLFQAITVSGTEYVIFKIDDCPVVVSNSEMVLSARPCSKILKISSLARGAYINGYPLFEGDLLYSDNECLGTVVYFRGFFLQDLEGNRKIIPNLSHIQVKKQCKEDYYNTLHSYVRNSIKFKYGAIDFNIHAFVCTASNGVGICCHKMKSGVVQPGDIHVSSGFTDKDTGCDLYYGDEYKSGIITLSDTGIAIWQDNKGRSKKLKYMTGWVPKDPQYIKEEILQ